MAKIGTRTGLVALSLGIVASLVLLFYGPSQGSGTFQTLTLLVSLGVMFYASHPLGHLLVGQALGVSTDHFFLGRSDFRKLKQAPLSSVGNLMPTIGTKLNRPRLQSLSPRRRGWVFGAGVIVSNSLIVLQMLYAVAAGYATLALAVGGLFVAATLLTEAMFSTEVGDLAKMRRQLRTPSSAPSG